MKIENYFYPHYEVKMPVETCMELAIWYYRLGCIDEMKSLLSISPSGREIDIWKKYFSIQQNSSETTSSLSAIPVPRETAALLGQQIGSDNSWQLKYSLALIYQNKNNIGKAKELFNGMWQRADLILPFMLQEVEV
jgi:hypothetical protein